MAEGRKKLYRSRDERWIAGVCGGIGDYFDLDPTVIRVLFILAFFIFGGGLWVYLILWVIIPLNKADFYPPEMISSDEPPAEESTVEETPEEEGE
jgi:phage shock protein PspC (stress-responsive transcriptional regulator)